MSAPTCMECGAEARLVGGEVIYPHRRDLYAKSFWKCDCGAYCGCHPNTTNALGSPCGEGTRKARSLAHSKFDPIWRGGKMSRGDAYKWLAGKMKMSRKDCHIGMMTAEQAFTAVAIIEATEVSQ